MYDKEMEDLIDAALMDGILEDYEKEALLKKADQLGIDRGELMMVVNSRLQKMEQEKKKESDSRKPRKCPKCGATLESYMAACPECGYTFDAVANKSSKELADKLLAVGTLSENNASVVSQIITTFPIPNAKGDLAEFVTSLLPRIFPTDKTPTNIQVANAYRIKLDECVNKINLSFPNDKLFASFMESWPEKKKQSEKDCSVNPLLNTVREFIRNHKALTVLLLIILLYSSYSVISNYICELRYTYALKDGRWDDARRLGEKIGIYSLNINDDIGNAKSTYIYNDLLSAVKEKDVDKALELYRKLEPDTHDAKNNMEFLMLLVENGKGDVIESSIYGMYHSTYIPLIYEANIKYLCEQGKKEEAKIYVETKLSGSYEIHNWNGQEEPNWKGHYMPNKNDAESVKTRLYGLIEKYSK